MYFCYAATDGQAHVAPKKNTYKVMALGCYDDVETSRDMPEEVVAIDGEVVTRAWCAKRCSGLGFPYAGLQATNSCFCGTSYGRYSKSSGCDFQCADNMICGGTNVNTVVYSINQDPIVKRERQERLYTDPAPFEEARRACIRENGDLYAIQDAAVINKKIEAIRSMPGQAGSSPPKVWIGIQHNPITQRFEWSNPSAQAINLGDLQATLGGNGRPGDCGVLKTIESKNAHDQLEIVPCSTPLPYLCDQIYVPPDPNPTADSGDDEEESGGGINEDIVFFLILPLFVIIYGGSCLVYIIGKSHKYCKRRKKLKQAEEEIEEKSASPASEKRVSPPPPYDDKQQLMAAQQTAYRDSPQQHMPPPAMPPPYPAGPAARVKKYKHEEEEPDLPAIDFSKLSIQDILYIKGLMGDRRPPKKTRQIYHT